MLKQVPAVYVTVCTFTSQSVVLSLSNRTKKLSSTTAFLSYSYPLFLSSPTVFVSLLLKFLRRDRYLLIDSFKSVFLFLYPYLLLFSSHPLISPLIAEPAVASAAAALALHRHILAHKYKLTVTETDKQTVCVVRAWTRKFLSLSHQLACWACGFYFCLPLCIPRFLLSFFAFSYFLSDYYSTFVSPSLRDPLFLLWFCQELLVLHPVIHQKMLNVKICSPHSSRNTENIGNDI